jgi:hypothetical protein
VEKRSPLPSSMTWCNDLEINLQAENSSRLKPASM